MILGHYGDALAVRKGDCRRCACDGAGALLAAPGVPQCDALDGRCTCAPHVAGPSCSHCEDGYFDLTAAGCRVCACNVEGSLNRTCDAVTGDCPCKTGVTGYFP